LGKVTIFYTSHPKIGGHPKQRHVKRATPANRSCLPEIAFPRESALVYPCGPTCSMQQLGALRLMSTSLHCDLDFHLPARHGWQQAAKQKKILYFVNNFLHNLNFIEKKPASTARILILWVSFISTVPTFYSVKPYVRKMNWLKRGLNWL
jgi:hypothetical protein